MAKGDEMRWINGRIYLGDSAGTIVSALAVADGRIRAVGDRDDLVADGETFDLRGLAEARLNVDLADARSADDAAQRVAMHSAVRAPGQWIVGRGWDQTRWPGQRFPDRQALDALVPDTPVALTRVDGHALWVNSAALTVAGIDDTTPDPPGGRILRDAAGHATGILLDAAADRVRKLVPPLDDATLREALSDAARLCASVGLTGVHEMGVDQRQIVARSE